MSQKKFSQFLAIIFFGMMVSCASPNDVGPLSEVGTQSTTNGLVNRYTPFAPYFNYPVQPYTISAGNDFGKHGEIPGYSSHHLADDIVAPEGALVYSAAKGRVKFVGVKRGYGLVVLIEHLTTDGPKVSLYGHLDPNQLLVSSDEFVNQGDVVGVIGGSAVNGGWSPHLHFGIKKGAYKEGVNPCGVWNYAGYVSATCKYKNFVLATWEDPSLFIKKHLQKGATPTGTSVPKSVNGVPGIAIKHIDEYRKRLNAQAVNAVHWYYHDVKIAVQDIKLKGGCDAALMYDVAGQANTAYLVKCGMWKGYASLGGPRSKVGNPISDELGGHQICPNGTCFNVAYQFFTEGYLTWESNDPARVKEKRYKNATPGTYGNRWAPRISYKFAEAFVRNHVLWGIGEPGHPHGGTPNVHCWHSSTGYCNTVQDFVGPKWGWTILMLNDAIGHAYMIRSGFWQQYRDKGLVDRLGQPKGEEFLKAPSNPRQEFEGGWMEYRNGVFRACMWSGEKACASCGSCPGLGVGGSSDTCIAGQTICEGDFEKKCNTSSVGWSKRKCAHGCSDNQCNICKPGSTWCHDINTMQVCSTSGKRFVSTSCTNGCHQGVCANPQSQKPRLCIARQTRCVDLILETCTSTEDAWTRKRCAHGCSDNQCNICKPGSQWCFDSQTIEKCTSSGKASIRTSCPYGCFMDQCRPKPLCMPNELRCNGKLLEKCSQDTWRLEKRCDAGCANGTCKSPPIGKICVPHIRRCIFGNEVQQCHEDGMHWVSQFRCAGSCLARTATCASNPPCTVEYNSGSRIFKISGTHGVTHWSSEGDGMTSEHWMKTHLAAGLQFTVPAKHIRVFGRNTDSSKDWPMVRQCEFIGDARWVERSKGGCVQLLK